jgi:hypothetical protein
MYTLIKCLLLLNTLVFSCFLKVRIYLHILIISELYWITLFTLTSLSGLYFDDTLLFSLSFIIFLLAGCEAVSFSIIYIFIVKRV